MPRSRIPISAAAAVLLGVVLSGCSGSTQRLIAPTAATAPFISASALTVATGKPTSTSTTTTTTTTVVESATALATTPTAPPTTVPATTPPTTNAPTTTKPPPPPTTAKPKPTVTTPAHTAPPVAPTACSAASGKLTTPSGRHILLRAAGLTGPSPTIFVIHGYTGTPTGVERVAEITAAANARGIAVAYPEGTPTVSGGFGWSTGAGIFATKGVDDVEALGEMIDRVIATGCVDPARMTLTGESNGGGMTLVALCTPALASRFQQFLLVNPAIDPAVLANCAPGTTPRPITVVAGLLDRTVPYNGGRPPLLSQQEWFGQFATGTNLCQAVAAAVPVTDHVVDIAGHGCAACSQLLVVDNGPHTWPGTDFGEGGLTPGTYDLNTPLINRVLSNSPGCIVDP